MSTFGNLKLDSNWDIIPGKGMTRVVGVEYIAQLVKCRLLTLYGEWDLDQTLGVPWFNDMLGTKTGLNSAQQIILNTITQTWGVYDVIAFDAQYSNRQLNISFTAASIFGDFTSEVSYNG